MDLGGKVCVVTGASSGIGARIARDLADAGATVCAAARREDRLSELVDGLPTPPGASHSYVVTDVSDRTQVDRLATEVRGRYGRCDVLVNNAGMSRGRAFEGESSIAALEEVFATNFFGAVYCAAALLPLLEATAPAHVVNIASIAGRIAFGNGSAYCASKFALVGWSEAVAFDLRERGVHVSLIEPGPVPTEGFPQEALMARPVLRGGLSSAGDVSRAVMSSIARRKTEMFVPRWFYLLQFPKLLFPGLFRWVVRTFAVSGAKGD
ncbi:MAG: SDR family NAD(P)-dependent oxidoreductase [Actinobacteria bacterium]|nr:SDR family NAD(P)-dependent oxidoreductase [Actinomycetota bacterium]